MEYRYRCCWDKEHDPIPAGARESSCAGGVIAAGFQNSHVHFTGEQFNDAGNQAPEALTRRLGEMLTRYGILAENPQHDISKQPCGM